MQNTKIGGVKYIYIYRGAGKSLARPGRKEANVSIRMAWISFGALPCRKKKYLMTARFSTLLKSRASLTCFRVCFRPGRAKDLSAPDIYIYIYIYSLFLDEGDYPWIWYHVGWYIDTNLSEIFAVSIFRVFCLACPEDGDSSHLKNDTFISIFMT